jgi:hypothetical protein
MMGEGRGKTIPMTGKDTTQIIGQVVNRRIVQVARSA